MENMLQAEVLASIGHDMNVPSADGIHTRASTGDDRNGDMKADIVLEQYTVRGHVTRATRIDDPMRYAAFEFGRIIDEREFVCGHHQGNLWFAFDGGT